MTSPFANSRMRKAIEKNNLRSLKAAIKAGADVNSTDSVGYETPLHDACNNRNVDAVRLLLNHGADPNMKNKAGETPLFNSCEYGYTEIVKLLLEKGADPNVGNRFGCVPLHSVSTDRVGDPTAIIEGLLEKGANINAPDRDNDTPLHRACLTAREDVVRLLLSHGADVNAKSKWGYTALDEAVDLPNDTAQREEIIGLFRQYAPELVLEAFCTMGPRR